MVLNISESGLLLESSVKAMAGLPTQAFAITLSGSDIENMIACVQHGGDIQLSMGSSPRFLFDDREVRIPKSPDPSGYDLFRSNSENPSSVTKLPNPTMSIFDIPKRKLKAKASKAPKLVKGSGKEEAAVKAAPARGPTKSTDSALNLDSGSQSTLDDDIAHLQSSYAKVQGDNKTMIVTGLPGSKRGKARPANRLLEAQAAGLPRSLPPSPALSGTRSPSLAPAGNAAQERAKQQRFPIIHELAVKELSWQELQAKWDEGTEEEFSTALNKVADFDNNLHKFALTKMYWKELDVFEYNYASEEDRQKAINNAIKQYDRMRLGMSDPLWQKLLPKSERGKGICLSKLQANIVKGPPAPKLKPDTASVSGGDSEKDDSAASSTTKKSKGGEPMSRSSSQASIGKKKLSASEAQAKRMLSTSKKPAAAAAAKAAPKVSPVKAGAKPSSSKGARVLSKEFVSESSSDDDEVPLSTSMPKSKAPAAPAPRPSERAAEKPKAAKPREAPAPKPKAAPAAKTLPRENERDTIRAQVIAKPIKPPAKRPRDAEDDDSSSSGTPLSKRVKPAVKAPPAPVTAGKSRTVSDASQNGRAAVAQPKAKNTSSMKSSPLASSPPTNASDLERDRPPVRERDRDRDRSRDHDRDTNGTGTSTSSSDSSVGVGPAKKRPVPDSLSGNKIKRVRPSQDTMDKASKFRQFYARYEQLHYEIAGVENPDPNKVTDLLDMRDRLSRMKEEIYASVDV